MKSKEQRDFPHREAGLLKTILEVYAEAYCLEIPPDVFSLQRKVLPVVEQFYDLLTEVDVEKINTHFQILIHEIDRFDKDYHESVQRATLRPSKK